MYLARRRWRVVCHDGLNVLILILNQRKLMTLEDTGESDSSVNARLESSPTKKRKVTRRSTVRKPKYTNDLDGFIASDSNEEEDEEPATKSPKKSSKIKPRSPTYSDEVEEDKEEEQPVRRRLKQRGKAKRRSPSPSAEEDHDEDEEEPIKSYSRNRSKAKEGESHDLSEREELQQELEDLQDLDSSPPPAARKDSSRDMRKASLADLLKARGAMRSHGRAVVHIDSGNEDESQEEEFEEEYEATFRDHQVETEADRDFIDEDDPDGEFGVPEIPLELSRFASAKLSTLFRHVVQWMLQREVIPGFEGTELQNFAFKRVGDKLTGLANNYISSVWSEQFTLALKARPEFCEEELSPGEKLFHPSCEACNRTNHPASWAIRFDKKAYDEKTLVEVKSKRRNNKGKEIAPMTKVFYLGSECANNARNAHPLIHWSYILFDHINEQWPAKEELKFNSHWDTEKKMKKVQKFVDDMQDNGQIKRLFRSFTNDIDVAQQFKAEDW